MSLFVSRKDLGEILRRPSAQVLIGVNLAMIAGVVVFDWSVLDIVFLYWVENLVVGVINVFRMLLASPSVDHPSDIHARISERARNSGSRPMPVARFAGHAAKLVLIPFFIVHYGGFCYGHGVFVLAMFGDGGMMSAASEPASSQGFKDLLNPGLILAIACLAASHLYSFFNNYLAGGEYRHTHVGMLMMRPYGRIVALHITILFGAFLAAFLDNPLGMLIILVLMKTGADLALHQAERTKLSRLPG